MTELDDAHAALQSNPEDERARLRFYERLADSELFVLLESEPVDDEVTPETIEQDGTSFVLVFDREARLADYAGAVASYAGLSGRALVRMLAGQGAGLALNPDAASPDVLIAPDIVDWLAGTLAGGPTVTSARPVEVAPPQSVPEALLAGLDRKLAASGGMAQMAWLVSVRYDDGSRGHLLAFVGAIAAAEPALAAAVAEALTFSGIEAGAIDVTFLAGDDPIVPRIARVGLRFDLPTLVVPAAPSTGPGMDPDKPPRLI
jgi:hypothetical protein